MTVSDSSKKKTKENKPKLSSSTDVNLSSKNSSSYVSEKSVSKVGKDKSKKNTSLRLDKKTLKALKMVAIEQETSVQKLIEGLIEDFLNNRAQ
ncbi:hypothetical protein ACFOEK_18920 [Litoribrevibacter euphylliae]|uniref:Ribbon-helix-helix protein, CopG family n=1 Tax=Litoribrevibacter euphylliae TaxID=1834034 RepID=A0ABV7HGW9_9GAMM